MLYQSTEGLIIDMATGGGGRSHEGGGRSHEGGSGGERGERGGGGSKGGESGGEKSKGGERVGLGIHRGGGVCYKGIGFTQSGKTVCKQKINNC